MTLSLAFSPCLFTQSELDSLIEMGIRDFYVPIYSMNWVEAFGDHIQPCATREFLPTSPEVYIDIFKRIKESGGNVTAILDGELSSPKELSWLDFALGFLDENGVKQVCISSPAIPLMFSEKYPHISWVASHNTLVYTPQSAAFWADLGIYRIILPYQITGAEVLAAIHYSSNVPVKFSVTVLGRSFHQLDGGCRADCDWISPPLCTEPMARWLEPDPIRDAEFMRQKMQHPDRPATRAEGISVETRYAYSKKIAEKEAVSSAFSPIMPLQCGACLIPQLSQIPNIQLHVNGVRTNAQSLIQYTRFIVDTVNSPAKSQTVIQAELNQPTICNSRHWCLYPDQVGKTA